jgi:hypothetical protein
MRFVVIFLIFFLLVSLACMETTQATPNKGIYAISRNTPVASPSEVNPGELSPTELSPTSANSQATIGPDSPITTPADTQGVPPTGISSAASTDLPRTTAANTPNPNANSTPAATQTDQLAATSTQPLQFEGEPGSEVVLILNISYNGSGQNEPDEFVEISNLGDQPVQLHGWTIEDDANHLFTFPEFTIQPDQVCRVYTNEIHSESCGLSFGFDETAIWNNDADCATLNDDQGILIDQYCYQE